MSKKIKKIKKKSTCVYRVLKTKLFIQRTCLYEIKSQSLGKIRFTKDPKRFTNSEFHMKQIIKG